MSMYHIGEKKPSDPSWAKPIDYAINGTPKSMYSGSNNESQGNNGRNQSVERFLVEIAGVDTHLRSGVVSKSEKPYKEKTADSDRNLFMG